MSELQERVDEFLQNRVRKLFDENTRLREELDVARADQALLAEMRVENAALHARIEKIKKEMVARAWDDYQASKNAMEIARG